MNPYTHDERLTEAQKEQVDASYDALKGTGGGSGGGGALTGAGAAGAVMLPMIIVGTFVIFMLYACFYPVAALVALATGFIVSQLFDAISPGVGWIAHYMIMLPFAFSALMIFRGQEWRLERKRTYLIVRHVLRLAFTVVIVGLSTTFITHMDDLRDRQPIDESYSWLHFAIVVAAVVVVHFVGRWQDKRIAASIDSDRQEWARESKPKEPRVRVPGMELLPGPLRRGLPVMALVGGVFGAFLGYAGFETATSTLVGLFAGCVGGALLMFGSWVITRPVGRLFDRFPALYPILMGSIIGAVVAWRLALADKLPLSAYLLTGIVAGALVLAVPYLLYAGVRRLTARTA
jgi:hypothetical protein